MSTKKMPNAAWFMVVSAMLFSVGATKAGEALEVTQGTVIRNVTVVNTHDGSLAPGMAVVIEGDSIRSIVPDSQVRVSDQATSIDASARYVVPGYLDMHTHIVSTPNPEVTHWPLLLANGVTGIREMAGSEELLARAERLNAESEAGRLDGPEILSMPSDLFAAPIPPEAAVEQVKRQKAQGADFIKVVNARPDTMFAILAEAKAQGLGVAGHLSIADKAADMSAAGWRSIEHLGAGMGILLDCADEGESVRRAILAGEGAKPTPLSREGILSPMLSRAADAPFYRRVLDTYNEEKCERLAKVFVENETWHAPTLIRLRTMLISNASEYRSDANLKYLNAAQRDLWEQLAKRYDTVVPQSAAAVFQQYYSKQRELVGLLKRSGVKMTAGSDTGGIWIIPGFGLHQEFRELVAAGLSPLEVLQMTTLNAAEFLHRESSLGSVDEGKRADLVLLDANPLDSVENLSQISGVFLRGRYFSAQALDDMKHKVAQHHSNSSRKGN